MSGSMNEELLRIIHKSVDKFDLSPDETVTILKLLSRTLLKTKNIEPKKKFNKCADKDDNIFFECAIEGNANYIISRDKHLHDVKQKHKLVNSKGGLKMRSIYGRYITIQITTTEENTDIVKLIQKEIGSDRNCDIFKMSIRVNKDCDCIINNQDNIKLTADYGFVKEIEDPIIKSFVIKEIGISFYAFIGY